MITEYIELTWAKNNTRHLFSIESLQSIGEAMKEKTTIENGIEKIEEVKVCFVIVNNVTWEVIETYDQVKNAINKIGDKLHELDK